MLEGLELLKRMGEETETLNRPVSSNLGWQDGPAGKGACYASLTAWVSSPAPTRRWRGGGTDSTTLSSDLYRCPHWSSVTEILCKGITLLTIITTHLSRNQETPLVNSILKKNAERRMANLSGVFSHTRGAFVRRVEREIQRDLIVLLIWTLLPLGGLHPHGPITF